MYYLGTTKENREWRSTRNRTIDFIWSYQIIFQSPKISADKKYLFCLIWIKTSLFGVGIEFENSVQNQFSKFPRHIPKTKSNPFSKRICIQLLFLFMDCSAGTRPHLYCAEFKK